MVVTKGIGTPLKHGRQAWTNANPIPVRWQVRGCEGDQASRDSEQPQLVLSTRLRGSPFLDRLQDCCAGRLASVGLGIYLSRRFCFDPIEVPLIVMSAAAARDRADMAFILPCRRLARARDHLHVLVSVAYWTHLRHRSLLPAQVLFGPDDHRPAETRRR